ncbi:MAG: hypothetical protein FJ191_10780 [Gammaproteobacteria bacterium]|nr:hypothetical protein [Gammaproteobacteria bacterium]
MNQADKVLFLAHSRPGSYVFRQTAQYLERFPEVEIRAIADDPGPFPQSVEEITLLYMLKAMDIGVERHFLAAIGQAEREGYGAAACASAGDFACAEARERYSIPYVGMGWASYREAVAIGGRFSHLHTHMAELIMPISIQQISAYGFREQLVSVEYVDVDIYRCLAAEADPDFGQLLQIFAPQVKKAAAKGARAITIGCGSPEFSRLAQLLDDMAREQYGVRVLPPIDTVVKVAREFLGSSTRSAPPDRSGRCQAGM